MRARSPSGSNPAETPAGAAAAHVQTADGRRHPLAMTVAGSFITRAIGLMGARPWSAAAAVPQAMLLTRCASVHTCFMRFAIDVLYLDARGTVVQCAPRLRPWRLHARAGAMGRSSPAVHTLELAAGVAERLDLRPGDRLVHPLFDQPSSTVRPTSRRGASQRGSAMIEFAIVGPMITMLGLAVVQYAMLFIAKNQINHATFMAARAGTMAHADLGAVRLAYAKALVPLYGGGSNTADLAVAYARATADAASSVRIELLNPTKESFDDWSDKTLLTRVGNGHRVIPNGGQSFKDATAIGKTSGQSIQDANLIKLRITHGYLPKIPFIAPLWKKYLEWLDPGDDAVQTALIQAGRVPVVAAVTLHMQSDAIEQKPVSNPGPGNGGHPVDPGDPPVATGDPPACPTAGCTVAPAPPYTPPPDDGGPVCSHG